MFRRHHPAAVFIFDLIIIDIAVNNEVAGAASEFESGQVECSFSFIACVSAALHTGANLGSVCTKLIQLYRVISIGGRQDSSI